MSFDVPWVFSPSSNITGANPSVPVAVVALPAAASVPSGSSAALVVSNTLDQAINLKFFVNNPCPSGSAFAFPDLSQVTATSGVILVPAGVNLLITSPDPNWTYAAFSISPQGGAPLPPVLGRTVISTSADTDSLGVHFIAGTAAPDAIRFGGDDSTSLIWQPVIAV